MLGILGTNRNQKNLKNTSPRCYNIAERNSEEFENGWELQTDVSFQKGFIEGMSLIIFILAAE